MQTGAGKNVFFKALAGAFVQNLGKNAIKWCEREIKEIPFSPIPGAFRSENSPMIVPVINAIVSSSVSEVCVRASVQSGKTLAAELALAYIVVNEPGAILWLTAKDSEAKAENETRIQPLFENCAPVKALFPSNKNKKRLSSILFTNGATLWTLGANNRKNLQSRTIRWLFGDECWLWTQGRLAEARARVSAFGRRGKCVFFSQGSISGDDADRAFSETDAARWSFQCSHCKTFQPFDLKNLNWESARLPSGERDFARVHQTVRLVCEHCGAVYENTPAVRAALNASAKFIPQNESAAKHKKGFHWNALASMDWGDVAEMYLRAKDEAKKGKIEAMANFYQQRLALPWSDDISDEFSALATQSTTENRSVEYVLNVAEWEKEGVADSSARKFVEAKTFPIQPIPETATRLRFLSIDVQDGYFVFVLRQWSPTGDSRLITNGILQKIEEIEETREKWNVSPRLVFIDAGFKTQTIYEFCAKTGAIALQGARTNTPSFKHKDGIERVYSALRRVPVRSTGKAANAFYFSTLACKDKLKDLRDAGTARWALPADVSKEYLRQMKAEHRNIVNGKPIWINTFRKPNHYFDCEAMQVAAAYLTGIF